jgi:hypothetical protein
MTTHDCKQEHRIVRSESDIQEIFKKVDSNTRTIMVMVGLGVAIQFAAALGVFDGVRNAFGPVPTVDIIMAMFP